MNRHPSILRSALLAFALLGAADVLAQRPLSSAEDQPPPVEPVSLASLVEASDLVALAQVADTDYVYARGFPTGGTAILRPLIGYKLTRPLEDLFELYEEGLREYECYFDNPPPGEEGRRFLVFAKRNEKVADQYVPPPQGCALEVLVTADNRYALKLPVEGVALSDDLAALGVPMDYADRYAVIGEDDVSPAERDRLLEGGWIEPAGDGAWRYTKGVDLAEVRRLLGPEALTLDRSLKR